MSNNNVGGYPLIYARVGSIVKEGEIPLINVLDTPVTVFKNGGTGKTYMSGQSRYVQSEEMNKGSFGVSGSYGVSGIAKVGFAASGYVGNSVAKSGTSVNVNYNAYISAGVEHLKVGSLSIEDLINALAANPKRKITHILDKYLVLYRLANNPSPQEIINSTNFKQALTDWHKELDSFYDTYGDGLVVAIHWGAFGSVKMELTNKTEGNSWKYGAEAEFSYSGIGGGTSVKATYDGSKASSEAEVDVNVTSEFTGDAIRSLIDSWRSVAEGKAFSEIAEVNMLAKAPPLEVPKDIKPEVKEFKKPEKDKGLSDKIGNIKDLKGLEAYAKAQAYEKEKEKNPNLTLDEFLKGADQPADVASIPDEKNIEQESSGWLSALGSIFKSSKAEKLSNFAYSNEYQAHEVNKEESDMSKHFVPLGLLVCSWSDIFPWLSKGAFNSVENLDTIKSALQWRGLIQDFMALSNIYYTAAAIGLEIGKNTTPLRVADSFSNMTAQLQKVSSDGDYIQAMKNAYEGLNADAKVIYDVWLKAGTWGKGNLLRKAELGLGFIIEDANIQKSIKDLFPIRPGDDFNQEFDPIKSLSLAVPEKSNFNGHSYSDFAQTVKLFPIITADGSIRTFTYAGYIGTYNVYEKGNNGEPPVSTKLAFHPLLTNGYIKKDEAGKVIFQEDFIAHSFLPYGEPYLRSTQSRDHISLYPIPFSAAEGSSSKKWKGPASGIRSLSSFKDLISNFSDIKKNLSNTKAWTFVGAPFKDLDLSNEGALGEIGLSDLELPTHYIGIAPEKEELMSLD